jgi:hypothetical protein
VVEPKQAIEARSLPSVCKGWLRVALIQGAIEEGFRDDTVDVVVDSNVVYRRNGVTTRLQIGLADTFEATVESQEVTVNVDVPTKSATASFVVSLMPVTHLGISIQDGAIIHRISAEPFRYA